MKNREMTDELKSEIARRFKDRNETGYWGINARAWIRHHIKAVRKGNPRGFTGE